MLRLTADCRNSNIILTYYTYMHGEKNENINKSLHGIKRNSFFLTERKSHKRSDPVPGCFSRGSDTDYFLLDDLIRIQVNTTRIRTPLLGTELCRAVT